MHRQAALICHLWKDCHFDLLEGGDISTLYREEEHRADGQSQHYKSRAKWSVPHCMYHSIPSLLSIQAPTYNTSFLNQWRRDVVHATCSQTKPPKKGLMNEHFYITYYCRRRWSCWNHLTAQSHKFWSIKRYKTGGYWGQEVDIHWACLGLDWTPPEKRWPSFDSPTTAPIFSWACVSTPGPLHRVLISEQVSCTLSSGGRRETHSCLIKDKLWDDFVFIKKAPWKSYSTNYNKIWRKRLEIN